MHLRALTWNLFHGRAGGPAPTAASTLLRRPVRRGAAIHLNRRLVEHMARLIAARNADVVALQEVPVGAVPDLVRLTGHTAIGASAGRLLGPAALRERLGRANPDLWRTHQPNCNLLLLGPRLRPIPGGRGAHDLTPAGRIIGRQMRRRLGPRRAAGWWVERRRLVWATAAPAAGAPRVLIACTHWQPDPDPAVATDQARATVAILDRLVPPGGAGMLLGDLNVHPGHPALTILAAAGWHDDGPDRGIDRILVRGCATVEPPRPLPRHLRTLRADGPGGGGIITLSDHDPVEGVVDLAAAGRGRPPG